MLVALASAFLDDNAPFRQQGELIVENILEKVDFGLQKWTGEQPDDTLVDSDVIINAEESDDLVLEDSVSTDSEFSSGELADLEKLEETTLSGESL